MSEPFQITLYIETQGTYGEQDREQAAAEVDAVLALKPLIGQVLRYAMVDEVRSTMDLPGQWLVTLRLFSVPAAEHEVTIDLGNIEYGEASPFGRGGDNAG